ncbi:2-oxoglutarate-dependent dioxygenase AOP3-like [Eucalyptus grandis]|uniref:2-oxoglutarate-dependent dioxygenase AOP3-like n=1 Tax=Eucalyptus grandis TaxID=71139 RepID=UPI00192ED489|nr:2-oxoglutarate-dependent dioxygenase AOP3-like [Eucalyptus grandis]
MNIDGAEKLEECESSPLSCGPLEMTTSGTDLSPFIKTVHDYGKFIAEIEKVVFGMVCETDLDANVNPIAHTDKSFLSYLHQNNIRGLEVRTKDGEWFTFEPSASTFMVMAGDACVAWSNGRIKACYHRVAVREESQVRYSLGTFSYISGIIESPEEFINKAHPRQYKPFNHIDFLCYYDSSDNRIKAESLIKSYCGVQAN